MADTATILLDASARDATACGHSLTEIAGAMPRLFKDALGMQVRNLQKSIAAVQRNYVIKHKVDGRTRTLRKFPPRHPITVALHGKKADGALTELTSISVDFSEDRLEVGFKGRLSRYCSMFQDGGQTGFAENPGLARYVQAKMHKDELEALKQKSGFRHECYKRLGRYGIHDQASLMSVSPDVAGKAAAAFRQVVMDFGGQYGLLEAPNLPETWQGRPYMDELGADLSKRFTPALVSIVEKKINGTIKRRPA